MSNSILNSEEFGQKIYDRFPIVYKSEDVKQNFTLKRYIQAIADGGFKPAIDEINGILELKDSNNTPLDVLMLLYEELGLELFNGIPELYLRYFFPQLADAWAKKGSLNAVKVVASALSGVKVSIEVHQSEEGMYMSMLNTNNVLNFDFVTNMYSGNYVNVRLEMDYDVSEHYFPDTRQFERLLKNFLPFYLDCFIIYSYLFDDYSNINMKEKFTDLLREIKEEEHYLSSRKLIFYESLLNKMFFTLNSDFKLNTIDYIVPEPDVFEDKLYTLYNDLGKINYEFILISWQPTLNNSMRELNNNLILSEFRKVDDFDDKLFTLTIDTPKVKQTEQTTNLLKFTDEAKYYEEVLNNPLFVLNKSFVLNSSNGDYGFIFTSEMESNFKLTSIYNEQGSINSKYSNIFSYMLNIENRRLNEGFILSKFSEVDEEVTVIKPLTVDALKFDKNDDWYVISNIYMDSFTFYPTLNTSLTLNSNFMLSMLGGEWGFIKSNVDEKVINGMIITPMIDNSVMRNVSQNTFNGIYTNGDILLNNGNIIVPDVVDVIIRNGVREIVYPRISA